MNLKEYTEIHATQMIKKINELLEYQNNVDIKYTIKKCTD